MAQIRFRIDTIQPAGADQPVQQCTTLAAVIATEEHVNGKKLAPVVRELGYPSKRNLWRWIRSWEAGGGAIESIRHKPRYTDEQKQGR